MKKVFLLLLLFISVQASAQERIQMKLENGVYTIPCTINGLRLRFIFDTGASNVLLSATEAAFMLKNEYLSSDDFQNTEDVLLADGSVVENAVVVLKEVKIGTKILNNVRAHVSYKIDSPLLLGQSVINLLGKWYIDNDALVLGAPQVSISEDVDDLVRQYEIVGDVVSAYNLLKDSIVHGDYESYEKWIVYVNKNTNLLSASNVDFDYDLYLQMLFEAIMADYYPLVEYFKKNPSCFLGSMSKRQYYYEALFKKGYHIVGKYIAQIGHLNSSISFDDYIFYLECSAKLEDIESYNLLGDIYNPTSSFLNFAAREFDITKSLYWYKKAADKNDPDGQYNYAKVLLGLDNPSSDQKITAINSLKKAANKKHKEAISELVTEYYYGYNVEANVDTALLWAKKLENDSEYKWWANAYIGFIHYVKGDKKSAVIYLERATNVDKNLRSWILVPSHTYGTLGEMYYWGEGVREDNNKALKLFLKEIEQSVNEDVIYCYSYVGRIYDYECNYEKSTPYIRYAAEQDDAHCQYLMAKYYLLGRFEGNPDFEKGVQWAYKAINNDGASDYVKGLSYRALGNIYSYDGQALYDMQKAVLNYEKASSYNDSYASFFLGEIYENGRGGIAKNFKLAEKYYRLAADQGYEEAYEKLKLFQ